jgi:ribosome maturation factor RimP
MKQAPKHPLLERVEPEVERTLQDFGYELVLMKFGGPPSNQTLSIYIDKPGGITSNDCQYMAERLSVLLDVLDPIQGRYHLLVSSPGVNRPLTHDTDFTRYAGKKAAVTYRDAEDKRVTLRGQLQGIEEDAVVVTVDEQTERVPLDEVEQAHLVYEWEDDQG